MSVRLPHFRHINITASRYKPTSDKTTARQIVDTVETKQSASKRAKRSEEGFMETLDLRLHPVPQLPSSRGLLTASDLKAAELLVQLSESSGGGADDWCSSSSTTRSVELPGPPPPLLEVEILLENEDDEEETRGPWRRTRRYRPIADVYGATAPVGVRDLDRRRTAERRNEKKSRRAED